MGRKEWTQEAVNQRLAAGKIPARVYKRSDGRLYLQATLPPKPGSDRPVPYQQKIYLHLPASEDGYRRAEQEARLLGGQIAAREFNWSMWLSAEQMPENKTAGRLIDEFRRHYMQTHTLKESTWINQWQKIYKRLPSDRPITADLLTQIVEQTDRNTRDRAETCRKLQALADYAGIQINLLQFKGSYGPSKVKNRDIPPDETIALWRDKIPNQSWQWIYGILAAFGLRDHEAFFCEWQEDGLFVTKGKTGPRLVHQALYPEWVEQWNLRTVIRPRIADVDRLYESGKLGDKVARQFRRYKIPFAPYDLRHAYGLRSSLTFTLDVDTAAGLMGHSPTIHLQRYHRHVKLQQQKDAAARIMNRVDRPKPPDV